MKNLLMAFAAISLVFAACSPKTGTAPVIPIPSGAIRSQAPVPGSAPSIQIGKAETFEMENGLKVIVVENHKLPTVAYQIYVDYDPVREGEAAGYVQMMGDLLGKGTTTRDKAAINEAVDYIGARLFTSANGASASCLTKHSEKLLDLMSDVLLNPTFPQEELDKAKKQAEGGLAASKEDPNAIAGNVSSVLRYGKDHPYGEIMTEQSLEKINRDLLVNHYRQNFKPNISYLIITGDIDPATAKAQANKYFGKWSKGEVAARKYNVPQPPEKTQVDFVNKTGAVQSVINITYPVELHPGHPDNIPSRLMNTILGGYFNSRVNANLREDKAYTYGANTSLRSDEIIGSFSASASVRNEVTDSSVVEFLKEISRLREEKVPEDELQLVKNVLTGSFSRSLEQPGTVANFALNTARYKLPADYYETYLAKLQAVTPDDILAMARKYLHPDRAHILIVGNKDEVADKLLPFSASGKVNFYDNYGNPDKSGEISIPSGVTAETIIADYLAAIGGEKKLAAVKDMELGISISGAGPEISIVTRQKGNTKMEQAVSVAGNVMSRQVYDGVKGVTIGMGGAKEAADETALADMKEQAYLFKEQEYLKGNYKMVLKGVETVSGRNAYVVEVARADGKVRTEFYDMENSLKLRESTSETGPNGETATLVNDFSDYKEVSGVLFPHTLTISGMFPVPMKASVDTLKINSGLEDAVFTIE